MAEQADARDLKSLGRNIIRVQFPSVAPMIFRMRDKMWNKILSFIDLSSVEYLIIFAVLSIYAVCTIIMTYDDERDK